MDMKLLVDLPTNDRIALAAAIDARLSDEQRAGVIADCKRRGHVSADGTGGAVAFILAAREVLEKSSLALSAALAFKTPPIQIYAAPAQHGHEWRCDIDQGVGHHGIGDTPAEALMNAAVAWRRSEREVG